MVFKSSSSSTFTLGRLSYAIFQSLSGFSLFKYLTSQAGLKSILFNQIYIYTQFVLKKKSQFNKFEEVNVVWFDERN